MSLFKGERTVWTVTETLRKVYVLLPDDALQEWARRFTTGADLSMQGEGHVG